MVALKIMSSPCLHAAAPLDSGLFKAIISSLTITYQANDYNHNKKTACIIMFPPLLYGLAMGIIFFVLKFS